MRERDKSFVNRCSSCSIGTTIGTELLSASDETFGRHADTPTRSSASSVVRKKAANFGRVKF